MDAYAGLFAELRRVTADVRRRRRRGPLDAANQSWVYEKLATLSRTLEGQPLYQALLLVTRAQADRAAGKPVAEAAAYVEAGRRFMDQELWRAAEGLPTMDEAAHMALVAFDLAVEVYREHGLHEEAGAVALSAAHQLRQCGLTPSAMDWFLLAGDCYAAGLPAPTAKALPKHPPAAPLAPALLGAVEAFDAAADLAVDVGDLELASTALYHLLRVAVGSGHTEVLLPAILRAAIDLALVLLVQKLHAEARATVVALLQFVELCGLLGSNRQLDAVEDPSPALSLAGCETLGVAQAVPLLQWLQEECEAGYDLPTIESLCLHLTSELAGHGDRPLRLLRALAEVYRRPAYADAVLRGGGPDCPPPGSPVPPPGGPAPS